jgi:uncharacterized protein (DUF433 family)
LGFGVASGASVVIIIDNALLKSNISVMKIEYLNRISIDPNICFGKPCIKGHRIWVSLILDMLSGGMTMDDILEDYPQLQREDILAYLAYGAEMARERYVEIPLEQTA